MNHNICARSSGQDCQRTSSGGRTTPGGTGQSKGTETLRFPFGFAGSGHSLVKMDDWRLLQEYLDSGSEAAFTALMNRHLNLVYSAARRRLGDPDAARDVSQAVFCLLAQKARRLNPRTALVGWLYQTACFKASCYLRNERRRQRRETETSAMHDTDTGRENAWERMAPHLDGAMQELAGPDRLVLLLRFFQRKPFKEIGDALGVGEDAARMRVNRALGRLRHRLVGKGVVCSATVLGAVLEENTIEAAPAWAADSVRAAVLQAARAASVPSVFTTLLLAMAKTKLRTTIAAGVLLLLGFGTGLYLVNQREERARQHHGLAPARGYNLVTSTVAGPHVVADLMSGATSEPVGFSNRLHLIIVTADSGRPVPNVILDCELREGTNATRKALQATRFGLCDIAYPGTITGLRLATQSDDFADTCLEWRTHLGESIPRDYTLRLTRSVHISGRVVDAQGRPVAGASIGFRAVELESAQQPRPERHLAGYQAESDAEGQWGINRVAPEVLPRLSGAAKHAEYGYAVTSGGAEARQQLLAGSYVFRLVRDVTAQGVVVTAGGQPVPEAVVGVQSEEIGEGRLGKTVTGADGSFSIPECRHGKNRLTAIARGFAPAVLETELKGDSKPVRLTLQQGKALRLRIVNRRGAPVPGAWVSLNNREPEISFALWAEAGQSRATDESGCLKWEDLPDRKISIDVSASGYMRLFAVKMQPDDQEHEVKLPPALIISGVVLDAATHKPVPHFSITCGWPRVFDGVANHEWSPIDRFRLNFERGKFRHVFEEPALATSDPEFVFKFEAEGYAPFVTRTVKADEGEVGMDVALRAAAAIQVTALLPNGQPAAFASIGLVFPGAYLALVPGGATASRWSSSSGALLFADVQGQFQLPADDRIIRVIGACAEGYGEAPPAALAAEPILRLQPWARIKGNYLIKGRPAVDKTITLRGLDPINTLEYDPVGFSAATDVDGGFVFPKVPPGRQILAQGDTPLTDVEVQPGQTTTVSIGGASHTLTMRLVWPEGLERPTNWLFVASVHLLSATTPAEREVSADPSPHVAPKYRLLQGADGGFVAEEVDAGEYLLSAWCTAPVSSGLPWKVLCCAKVSFTVPADPPAGVENLGQIQLEQIP
jgi:RNA polymerase sigma factor (sigma-70 family)